MKQTIPTQTISLFRFLFQESRLRLSAPALHSFRGSLIQVKRVRGQSNSGSPPSLPHLFLALWIRLHAPVWREVNSLS